MVIGAPQGGPKEAPSRAIAPQRCDTLACHLVAAPPAKGGLRLVVQRRRPTSLASNVKSEIIAVNIGALANVEFPEEARCRRFTDVTAPLSTDGHPCERRRALHRHQCRRIRSRLEVIALPVKT